MSKSWNTPVDDIELGTGGVTSQRLLGVHDSPVDDEKAWAQSNVAKRTPEDRTHFLHQDRLGRIVRQSFAQNWTLNPRSFKLEELKVQCSDSVLGGRSKKTWNRVKLKNGSPVIIRLSGWVWKSKGKYFVWLPACVALLIVVSIFILSGLII
jgi:hypothetical protein